MSSTIDGFGDPLAFKVAGGAASAPLLAAAARDTIKVEARQMAGHQKEAVVSEGAAADSWRLTSDEGAHLHGTDLAPFPLGFFNAGLQGDLYVRLVALAQQQGIAISDVEIDLINRYWLTGSFVQGTGEGHAEPTEIEVRLRTGAAPAAVTALVDAAVAASPAMALLRAPLRNTFALYINGRRRHVDGAENSTAKDAADPYRVYAAPPRPLAAGPTDIIEKGGSAEAGKSQPAASTITGKQIRTIVGRGRARGGLFEVETWLVMPGASHFVLRMDTTERGAAPSGLAMLSAGIVFCYMTQLARYIENMKLSIGDVRLVQLNPYVAGPQAQALPIDTHLFLNGAAPDETHVKLLTVAARTCYLHATAATPLDPVVKIVLNGERLAEAA